LTAGALVDAVVVMQRFDDSALFDALARQRRFDANNDQKSRSGASANHDAEASRLSFQLATPCHCENDGEFIEAHAAEVGADWEQVLMP
jgi:aminoglycoside phosphotransferase family enzyme